MFSSANSLALRTAFPLKTDEQILELLDAAGFRPNVSSVMYKLLFLEVSWNIG